MSSELDAGRTKDQSVWDIYPKGIILPWFSNEELPKSMQKIWAICNGQNGTPT